MGTFLPGAVARLDTASELLIATRLEELKLSIQSAADDFASPQGELLQRARTLSAEVVLETSKTEDSVAALSVSWLSEVAAGALLWEAIASLCATTRDLMTTAFREINLSPEPEARDDEGGAAAPKGDGGPANAEVPAQGQRPPLPPLQFAKADELERLLIKHTRISVDFSADVPASSSHEYLDLLRRYAVQFAVMVVALGGGATVAHSRKVGFAVSVVTGILSFWLGLTRERAERARRNKRQAGDALYAAVEKTAKEFGKAWLGIANRFVVRNERSVRQHLAAAHRPQ